MAGLGLDPPSVVFWGRLDVLELGLRPRSELAARPSMARLEGLGEIEVQLVLTVNFRGYIVRCITPDDYGIKYFLLEVHAVLF